MSDVGQRERMAQNRVVRHFQETLGFDYLGNWETHAGNSNVEAALLTQNLRARGYDENLINKAVDQLTKDASLGGGRDLYEANRDVYHLLRYGAKVRPGIGEQTETVWLVDWANPQANHFAIAEEVTVAPRARQIVNDILLDMETKPRLSDGRGNAMLVGASIYQACKFYELFCQAGFKGKCAIITSYEPQVGDIAKEDSGHGATERLRQYDIYRQMLADHFNEPADKAMAKVEQFEKEFKGTFITEPGQMRLLIVVDKLLTGFDAPSATYLYIDKKMRDHGLFQAICRVNRLDGDDKDYGYIVDYQDLFNSLSDAITDYTSGALDGLREDRH